MPNPQPPRRPDPQPKPRLPYEVVEDDDDVVDEVEVLDDEPAPPRPAQARKPVRAVPDDTAERDPATKAAGRKPVRAAVDDGDDGPRPKPKKKGKKKPKRDVGPAVDEDQAARDRALAEFEWIWPCILLGLGVVMTFVGAFGVSDGVSAIFTLGLMAGGLVVAIPCSIAFLMVVGMVAGIEYGRFGPAILKIAAITFVVQGIYFVGAWIGLPDFAVVPIACAVSFGLFMAQFDLDMTETNTSVGVLNVTSFVVKFVLIGFLVVAEAGTTGGGDPDEFDDDPPAEFQDDGDPPPFDPDGDWDDE